MKKLILLGLLIIISTLSCNAAIEPPHADFEIDISPFYNFEGNWSLMFFPLGVISDTAADYPYNLEKFTDRTDFFNELKDNYIKLKPNDIMYHHFKNYHYTGGYIYNAEQKQYENFRSFYPVQCKIKDNMCKIHIAERLEGPYYVVLENLESQDEIYFSDLTNINWNNFGDVTWGLRGLQTGKYAVELAMFETKENNELTIEFINQEAPVACTMDAKACPDGSYVGRIAPDCEFEPCPQPIDLPEPQPIELPRRNIFQIIADWFSNLF
jgi:hypothetical protein